MFTDEKIKKLTSFDMETRILTIKGVSDELAGEYDMLFYILDEWEG